MRSTSTRRTTHVTSSASVGTYQSLGWEKEFSDLYSIRRPWMNIFVEDSFLPWLGLRFWPCAWICEVGPSHNAPPPPNFCEISNGYIVKTRHVRSKLCFFLRFGVLPAKMPPHLTASIRRRQTTELVSRLCRGKVSTPFGTYSSLILVEIQLYKQ